MTKSVEYRQMMVDPDLARKWLGKNDVNRQVKKGAVEKFTRDMKMGAWAFFGTPILLSEADEHGEVHLLDGQNRLLAVVASNTVQPFMVFFNMPIEVQAVVDSGNARTIADTLHMAGQRRAGQLAATARILFGISLGPDAVFSTRSLPSNTEIIDMLHNNPRIRTSLDAVEGIQASKLRYPVAATMWYFGEVREPEMTKVFFEKLISGAGMEKGDPTLAFRNRLTSSTVPTKRVEHQLWLGLRAMNMVRAGRKVSQMVLPKTAVNGASVLAEIKSLTTAKTGPLELDEGVL